MFSKNKYLLFILLTFSLLITACTSNSPVKKEKITLKVLYSTKIDFINNYEDFLASKFDHITFEVIEYGRGYWDGIDYVQAAKARDELESVSTSVGWDANTIIELINSHQPDLLFFPQQIAPQLIELGLLRDQTHALNDSSLQSIHPQILDYFIQQGQLKLYYLSDTYRPLALVYNEDILQNYGVDPLGDNITWQDVAMIHQSVEQLSDGEVQGLSPLYLSYADMFLSIGNNLGLTWYDNENKQTLFSKKGWIEAFQLLEGIRSKPSNASNTSISNSVQDLLQGNAAMFIMSFYDIDRLIRESNNQIKWNIISLPAAVDGSSRYFGFEHVNAVSSSSSQMKAAEEVWKYINGELLATVKHKTSFGRFYVPIHPKIIETDSYHYEMLYQINGQSTVFDDNEPTFEMIKKIRSYIDNYFNYQETNPIEIEALMKLWDEELTALLRTEQ